MRHVSCARIRKYPLQTKKVLSLRENNKIVLSPRKLSSKGNPLSGVSTRRSRIKDLRFANSAPVSFKSRPTGHAASLDHPSVLQPTARRPTSNLARLTSLIYRFCNPLVSLVVSVSEVVIEVELSVSDVVPVVEVEGVKVARKKKGRTIRGYN